MRRYRAVSDRVGPQAAADRRRVAGLGQRRDVRRRRTPRPARPSARSPTPPPTTRRPRSTPPAPCRRSGPPLPPNTRYDILQSAFELMNERSDELALLMTLEMGKSVTESKGEIAYAAEFFRWNAGEALRLTGDFKVAGNGASRVMVMRQPIGPCYLITPWNFPTAMGTRKIGPAIAAGCTMVMKPAQNTPLSMLALAEAARGVRPARPACSTSSPARRRARSRSRSSPTRGCASSASPARPRSGGC